MATVSSTPIGPAVPTQPYKRDPAYRHLDAFVGTWNMEGQQYDGPFGAAAKITVAESYRWLTGGFFLVHRFEGRLGDDEIACLEIIGYDGSSQSYPMRTFYSDGTTGESKMRERDGTWTRTGDWEEVAGVSLKVRCTTSFSDAGDTMTGKWEYSSDDSNWKTFWDVKAIKAK